MQKELERQVEENPTIKLNTNYVEMKENIEQEEKDTKIDENMENQIEEQQEQNEIKNEEQQEQNEIENEEQKEETIIENNQEITEKSEEKIEENNENIENAERFENLEQVENPETKLEEIKEQIKELEKMQYEDKTPEDFNIMYEKLFGTKPILNSSNEEIAAEQKDMTVDLFKDNISVFEESEEYKKTTYKFIGIVFNTYIIIEMDKEMYIIDQHAAHERIMYEKVKKNYYSETSKDSQMLLLPDVITLSHKEMEIAKDNMEMFEKAGFSLEEFGENTIKLTGVPTICIDIDNKELFLETLDEINTVARTAKQEKEEKFIATVACKAAVKANMVLDRAEVESLMDKLLELPNPFTCPHGRPTAIKMSKYDIERKFARK